MTRDHGANDQQPFLSRSRPASMSACPLASLLVVASILMLQGCQALRPSAQSGGLDETEFSRLWDLYSHCRASADAEAMRLDAVRLSRAAAEARWVDRSVSPFLPKALARLVSDPPLRLSVDPAAMAASCTLETGQVALIEGQADLAADMFRSVIRGYPQKEYTFYVEKAHAGLEGAGNRLSREFDPLPVAWSQ